MINHELLKSAEKLEHNTEWLNAYEQYEKIYCDIPTDEVLEKMAWCKSRAEKYNDAIISYKLLSQRNPKNAKYCYNVGYQYYATKKWDEATTWFNKALELYPEYFIVKYRLAYSLRQLCGSISVLTKDEFWQALKQLTECELIWNKMTDEEKKTNSSIFSDVCYQKGKMLVERKHTADAIPYFEKSLQLSTQKNEDCSYQLAKSYYELNNIPKAQEVIPQSNKYYVVELKINILVKLDKLFEAERLINALIQKRNKDYLHRQLSEVYIKQNKPKEAFVSASKAIELNPHNHINHYIFSKILFAIGLLNFAKVEVEKAIQYKETKYSSTYPEAIQLLQQINNQMAITNHKEDDQELIKSFNSSWIESTKQRDTLIGVVDIYYLDKGFGFIQSNSEKYFFHISNVNKNLQSKVCKGVKLKFKKISTEKGLSAQEIELLE